MSKVFRYRLPNITCINCIIAVKKELIKSDSIKIENVTEDVVEKRIDITVKDDTKLSDHAINQQLKYIIENTGQSCIEFNEEEIPKIPIKRHLIKGLVGVLSGTALMLLMMSGVAIPTLIMYTLMAAATLGTAYLGTESYQETLKKLFRPKSKTLTMDTLFTISTVTVIGVSIASFFISWLPMMMDAGLMIFGFRHIGKVIENSLKEKMNADLKFKNRVPFTTLKVLNENSTKTENAYVFGLQPNDIILVKKGELIPVDGICIDEGQVFETIITGSIFPKRMVKGAKVLAGMKVTDDVEFIRIKVTKPFHESHLAQLDEKIFQINQAKAPIENTTQKILQYFIPTVIGIALLSAILVGTLINPAIGIQCAITLLVSACPCTLGFITPLSIKIGMTKAVQNRIEFKTAKDLQAAGEINTVVFDINGTLTTGIPVVTKYHRLAREQVSRDEFFGILKLLEQESQHPIATAIVNDIATKNILSNKNLIISEIDKTNHSGISAKINGSQYILGNADLMRAKGIDISFLKNKIAKESAYQIVYLAKDNKMIGYVCLTDPLRKDAIKTVEQLKSEGMDVHICSGADQTTANQIANKLGIANDHVYANCLGSSEDPNTRTKIQYIKQLKESGKRVCMVGDAANDSLAMAMSDFSVAIDSKSGDPVSQAQAGLVVSHQSLTPIFTALIIAKQTVNNIKQNLLMSFTYNSAMMLIAGGAFIALGFTINPGIGVALMVAQASLVLLNQYRFKQQTVPVVGMNIPKITQPHSQSSSYQYLFQHEPRLISAGNNPNVKNEKCLETKENVKEQISKNRTIIIRPKNMPSTTESQSFLRRSI